MGKQRWGSWPPSQVKESKDLQRLCEGGGLKQAGEGAAAGKAGPGAGRGGSRPPPHPTPTPAVQDTGPVRSSHLAGGPWGNAPQC